jgi:hypothetical protein
MTKDFNDVDNLGQAEPEILEVLREFVADVQAAYPATANADPADHDPNGNLLEDDWPDLAETYLKALALTTKAEGRNDA